MSEHTLGSLDALSSEFILLRDSGEFDRHLHSTNKNEPNRTESVISISLPHSLATGNTHLNRYILDDDYQGYRDESGVLIYDYSRGTNSSTSHNTFNSRSLMSGNKPNSYSGTITYNADAVVATSDLELWWVTSPTWRRFIPIILFALIILIFANLIAGLYLIGKGFGDYADIPDPYICRSHQCIEVRNWITDSMNSSVSPCTDFYQYVCGNFQDAIGGNVAPEKLEMETAEMQYDSEENLGKVLLKPESDPVVKFYKSCLDERSRKLEKGREGRTPFEEVLHVIGISNSNYDLVHIAARLSNYTGNFGFFDYWYSHANRSITVDPIDLDYVETISENKNGSLEEITKVFSAIPNIIIGYSSHVELSVSGIFQLAKFVSESLQVLMTCLKEKLKACSGKDTQADLEDDNYCDKVSEKPTEEDLRIFNFSAAIDLSEDLQFHAYGSDRNYYFSRNPTSRCFLDVNCGQLHLLSRCLRGKGFSDERIKFSILSLWTLSVFKAYANSLDIDTFKAMTDSSSKLFALERSYRQQTIEIQCFNSLAADYAFIAFESLSLELGAQKILDGKVKEHGRAALRVLRMWDALGYLDNLKSVGKYKQFFDFFTRPESNIDILEKLYARTELKGEILKWSPDPKRYFWNSWNARRISEEQFTFDWFYDNVFTPWQSKIGGDLLQKVVIVVADEGLTSKYQNLIYLPIPMLTLPYLGNSYRIMDYAGIVSFISRQLVRLTLTDVSKDKQDDLNIGNCTHNQFSSALAIKLCLELYYNQIEFSTKELIRESFAYNTHIKIIKPLYNKSKDGVLEKTYGQYVVYPDGKIEKVMDVSKDEIRIAKLPDQKLVPKSIIGFENYTKDQIFFMTFLRHHCNVFTEQYSNDVNTVIKQIREFKKAWNCPPGSPMLISDDEKCIKF